MSWKVSVGVWVFAYVGAVSAATFVVNSADPGDAPAVCNAETCNLFGAAQALRDTPESDDVITFAIPGDGPHVIRSAGQVLALGENVEIDAFSQPGASPNSNPGVPDNASLRVVLDGELESDVGIVVAADVTIRGLEVVNFRHSAISISPEGRLHLTGSRVHGNWGMDYQGNISGVGIWGSVGSVGSVIGGPNPADRNILWNNAVVGADLRGDDNLIEGIWSGYDPSGAGAPNSYYGLEIHGSRNQVVNCWVNGRGYSGGYASEYRYIPIVSHGTNPIVRGNTISAGSYVGIVIDGNAATVEDNEIHGSLFTGIVVAAMASPTSQHLIRRNTLLDNWSRGVTIVGPVSDSQVLDNVILGGQTGIYVGPVGEDLAGMPFSAPGADIALVGNSFSEVAVPVDLSASPGPWGWGDGPTVNDPGDLDVGPNNLQNFPVLKLAQIRGKRTKVRAELDTAPGVYWVQWLADGIPFCKRERRVGAMRLCGQKFRSRGKPRTISARGLPAVVPGTSISATMTQVLGRGRDTRFGSSSELSPPAIALQR